jgi:DNA-binding SARP family transcriptional activator
MPRLVQLGSPCVDIGPRTLGPGKAVALLAYLSASPNRCAGRKDAFRLLYSDDSPRDADAFRQLLASLRKLLPGTFVTTGDLIQLTEPLSSDRQAFLDAVACGDYDGAVALYTAEFFDPFDEPGCDGFRRWAQEERLRLRRRFEVAAECVVRRQLAQADWAGALATATTVAQRFPALAVSARLLIETLLLSGRATDIRATLSELGATRVGAAPALQPRALDLLLDALAALAREHRLGDPRRPMIGREAEFRMVVEAWNSARSGTGATVFVTGQNGAGVSRLLANLALRLRLDTPSCIGPVTAESDTGETESIARQLAAGILPLPGALGTTPQQYLVLKRLAAGEPADADAPPDRQARMVVEALTDGLRAASEEAPVAILIDTHAHVSSETARLLSELSACLRSARVLVVVGSPHPLASVIETTSREQITLTGLDADQISILAVSAGSALSTDDAAAMHAETGGLPGLVRARLDEPGASATPSVSAPRSDGTAAPVRDRRAPATVRPWYRRPLVSSVSLGVLSAVGVIATVAALRSAGAESLPESFILFTWRQDSVSREPYVIGDDDSTSIEPKYADTVQVNRWPYARVPEVVRVAPDGETIAAQIETGGTNTMDIIGVRGDSVFPLVTGERDDGSPDWSPDGAMLAFSTNRWSTTGNSGCDIGIRSMASDEIWRVTLGPACDYKPRWTADGSGLAFIRLDLTQGGRSAICTLATFSQPPNCVTVDSNLQVVDLIGWRSASTVLYTASTDTTSAIYSLDIGNGRSTPLMTDLTIAEAELSPSRTYLACWCGTSPRGPGRITLFDLNTGRPVYRRGVTRDAPFRHITWHARGEPSQAPAAERVTRLQQLHRETMAAARARQIADTIDFARAEMKEARPKVERAARDRVWPAAPADSPDVSNGSTQLLFDERWGTIDTAVWVPFGIPRPRAGATLGGLDPGGDGSYPSGLYRREAFRAPRGFVLEARVAVPVTLPFWQGVALSVESERFAREVGRWPRDNGTWSVPSMEKVYEAGVQYPAHEGGDRAMTVAVNGTGRSSIIPISPLAGNGQDIVFRMEFGPDSMMTAFANGLRMVRRRYLPTPDGAYRLFLLGHSVDANVRVRRVRVWSTNAP